MLLDLSDEFLALDFEIDQLLLSNCSDSVPPGDHVIQDLVAELSTALVIGDAREEGRGHVQMKGRPKSELEVVW